MSDEAAQQLKDGGWNLVWCSEGELDAVQRHGLRAQLTDGLLSPATLDDPAQREKLDALIERVKAHPALYDYFITDEPNASAFPALGRLVEYIRERDPAHPAYINLFPTYASNEQLGTQGDTVTAYKEHLRQFLAVVRPDLISYDHYHFTAGGDGDQYFLNLGLIRRAALDSGLPFVNIIQACTWDSAMRKPRVSEVRWLTYTSLAYGAGGISHFVYHAPGFATALLTPEGQPTALWHGVSRANRKFVAIAEQLQPLQSLGAYHLGMIPPGATELPAGSAFTLDPPVTPIEYKPPAPLKGMLLGYFGKRGKPTHVLVVNIDYGKPATTTVVGPGSLEVFNATTRSWRPASDGSRARLSLVSGGGVLVRARP